MTTTIVDHHLLSILKARLAEDDGQHGFSEREAILADLPTDGPVGERICLALERLLEGLTPRIEAKDVFLGRMVEGPIAGPMIRIAGGGSSHPSHPFSIPGWNHGHMTLDYQPLLDRGLTCLAEEAQIQARDGDATQQEFAQRLARVVAAITGFAVRYAEAARRRAQSVTDPEECQRLNRAAEALENVPARAPADLFQALQSVWLVHLVFSAVVGGRDFAFGRLDKLLWPIYRRDLARGLRRDEAVFLLAHFFIKTNEITGQRSVFHPPGKPIPCMASKQYLILGGSLADGSPAHQDLSHALLEAAQMVHLPEPSLLVRWHPRADPMWKTAVTRAVLATGGQIQMVNDQVLMPALIRRGVDSDLAWQATFTGCSKVDLPGLPAQETYHNAVSWLVQALGYDASGVRPEASAITSMDALLARLTVVARQAMTGCPRRLAGNHPFQADDFHPESLLLRGAVEHLRDVPSDPDRLRLWNHFFAGIATIADSLAVIEHLVFTTRSLTLPGYLAIVATDFAGCEDLRHKVLALPRFGNQDDRVDRWARRAGRALVEALPTTDDGWVHVGGFFSLTVHVPFGRNLPATPDGRRAGSPISENQSPSMGADRHGPTALLASVLSLPFDQAPAGGLNVRLPGNTPIEAARSLIDGYFDQGGLHLGLTAVDRAVLEDARQHPDRYPDLLVRVTGFSERFTYLSPDLQDEVIARTTHHL